MFVSALLSVGVNCDEANKRTMRFQLFILMGMFSQTQFAASQKGYNNLD